MKLRRSFLIASLSLLMVFFAAFAAACKDGGANSSETFYRVTFVYDNGQENTSVSVASGKAVTEPRDPERDDFDFVGWFKEGAETPYDFSAPVTEDFSLYAHWQQETVTGNVRLTWIENEAYDFVFEGGHSPASAEIGGSVSFSVETSPFYIGTPVVTVRNGEFEQTLTAEDGVYTFTVPAMEGTFSFRTAGLEPDRTPIRGMGTSTSPYIIETPAQFQRFALAVNDPANERYNEAYIRLDADLDFKGETLDPIGADLSSTYFSGVFDGNGKTISNLIPATDTPLVIGIFGYIAEATVRDLHVVCDYDFRLDENQNFCVGGIVAYNVGSDIVGCTFEGDIRIDMARPYDASLGGPLVYLGGIVGFAQGYSTSYSATVAYCSVEGNLDSYGRYPLYAAGGIAGATVGTAESAPVLITNCTYSGSVGNSRGARLTGGAVGYLREYSGLSNVYTEGTAYAYSTDETVAAGGLVGFAENETAVVSSYSAMTHTAQGLEPDGNMEKGDVVGAYYKDGALLSELPLVSVDGRHVLVHDAYEVADGNVGTANASDFAAVCSLLGWADTDWTFENGRPYVNRAGEQSISVEVTFSFGGEQVAFEDEAGEMTPVSERTVTVTEAYLPINWLFEGSGMNTFVAESGAISYGYFLDAAHTQRIPSAMPVTRGMTIYVGFADYGEVEGEYYAVITGETQHEVHLTFNEMGMMTMYCDGMLAYEMYVWDGEKILIRDAYFANFAYDVEGLSLDTDYYAVFNDDKTLLTIYDNFFFNEANNFEVIKPIPAYPHNAAMGEWFTADDTYSFYSNGTGSSDRRGDFTYTCVDNRVAIAFGSTRIIAIIAEDGKSMATEDGGLTLSLSRLDSFAGVWEAEYGYNMSVSFDGMGNFTYEGEGGTYTVEGEEAVLTNGMRAAFNADGLLVLTEDGRTTVMGREGSFIGTWTDDALGYTLVMTGIGRDGYGFAYDSRGADLTYIAERESDGDSSYINVMFWYRTSIYGMGYESPPSPDGLRGLGNMLYLSMYTPGSGYMVDDYNMAYVDQFAGTWNAEDGTVLEFNGYGGYDINALIESLGGYWIVEGWVTYTAADGTVQEVRYSFDRNAGHATFKVNDVDYTAVFGGDTVTVTSTKGTVTYRTPDLFGGSVFQSADGVTVSFNGKSNVSLGKATVKNGNTETVYDYTLDGTTATLTQDGVTAYTAAVDTETNYLLVTAAGEDAVPFGYYSAAYGKTWLGPNGTTVTISEVFDLAGYATGEFAGAEDVLFELTDPASGTIAVYLYSETLPSFYLVPQNDDNLALFDDTTALIGMLCLPDGWEGEYTAADGSVLTIDGRGLVFGYYPQAELRTGDEDLWFVYDFDGSDIVLSELDRNGESDELIERYRVSRTQTAGAVEYTAEDGSVVYVTAITE